MHSVRMHLLTLPCQYTKISQSDITLANHSETSCLSLKGELRHKINRWSNNTLVPSQSFSEICFHDKGM